MECLDQVKPKNRARRGDRRHFGGPDRARLRCRGGCRLKLARFETKTCEAVRSFLPGNSGENPIDFGATILPERRKVPEALGAVLADNSVGALAIIQDSQASLNPYGLESYREVIGIYSDVGKQAAKPVVVVSPTFESLHERIVTTLSEGGVPLLRGLRAGLIAIGNLGIGQIGKAGRWARMHSQNRPFYNSAAEDLRQELSRCLGDFAAGPVQSHPESVRLAFRAFRAGKKCRGSNRAGA